MPSSTSVAMLSLLSAVATAQTTTTATILVPDWCVTQSAPTVTVLGQNSMTTYSYSCSIDTGAISSALADASGIANSALSAAQSLAESLGAEVPIPTQKPDWVPDVDIDIDRRRSSPNPQALYHPMHKRNDCFGYDMVDACIPWEVTQGASYWAVHYTMAGLMGLDQECKFGDGGVESGPATCTATGRIDPEVWGGTDGVHTQTFQKTDVDKWFIRNTVAVTAGGPAGEFRSSSFWIETLETLVLTIFFIATNAAPAGTGASGAADPEATGLAVPGNSVPTGVMAWAAGAGGVLAAALAL
ncbi:hypothetical protein BS50DRAFT_410366 [Corynespora cassiicola Philippines]|uniref:Uncharacterized protein n=1 Tax=Corynespora cassiicola Philippines TaxID=1448308 RepID=A0A2T2NLH2_CORCC|nr:hypothetical protein BS50DRAFT_410366 [Corynespora cassiicola Philippines]